MQYASGVRPYILEWYYCVFLKTHNAKTEPDSKTFENGERTEDRNAVTTEELVIATDDISNQDTNKSYSYYDNITSAPKPASFNDKEVIQTLIGSDRHELGKRPSDYEYWTISLSRTN